MNEKIEKLESLINKLGFTLGVWSRSCEILKDEIGYIKETEELEELEELRESVEGVDSCIEKAKETINEVFDELTKIKEI